MGGPATIHRFRFSYNERLHLDNEFNDAIKKGRRISNPAILIYALNRSDGIAARRLGLVTSRKVGTAVERNRLKRILREIFRLNKHNIAESTDIVFILRKAGVKLKYQVMKAIILDGLKNEGFYDAEIRGN